jgi:hypothetical protein
MYAVSATVSAYFFAMWKRADADVKSRVWRRYGLFSALAFWGSCAGLVSAAADIQFRYNLHRAAFSLKEDKCAKIKLEDYPDDPVQWFQLELDCYREQVSTYVQVFNRLSVQPVPYAIEFLCICCANLLVRLHVSLCLPVAACLFRPLPHNLDQVLERMVDFVGKGQQLGGLWLSLSARVAMVSVTVLNATNVVFMAVFCYYPLKGSFF